MSGSFEHSQEAVAAKSTAPDRQRSEYIVEAP